MGCALCLLGGGILAPITEHIDAWEFKTAVGTHGFPQSSRLRGQRRLFHQVTGQRDLMVLAPGSNGISKSLSKTFAEVVVVTIAGTGNRSLWQFPEQFWQHLF